MPIESKQALRLLLLPIRPAHEAACEASLHNTLSGLGILVPDYVAWIRVALGNWEDTGSISSRLKTLVSNILGVADPHFGPSLAADFFDLHSRLRTQFLFTHAEARAFLSHALLAADLAQDDMFSAAQISRTLRQRDHRVPFSRQSIGALLQALGLRPRLDEAQVKALFSQDSTDELPVLADSDLETAACTAATFGGPLGFPEDQLEQALRTLAASTNPATYGPYIQILHYQCLIAEFFDHSVTDLYEFQPRGNLPNWIFSQYPDSMGVAGNPFLNNAKSVEQISSAWVRSKGAGELSGANALYTVLSGLDAMGFAARRELARMIRLWALRAIRISKPLAAVLPAALTSQQIEAILSLVASGNTSSFGVIEQRVVDAVSTLSHSPADGWRSRGLKDAVNATNVSRRKLGDCDFQQAATRTIHAFESHGGKLTDAYVQDHMRTVRKSLALRVQELSGIADPSDWTIIITFVAHELAVTALPAEVISGVSVSCIAISFTDFLAAASGHSDLAVAFTDLFLEPIGQRRTPLEVRNLVSELL